MKKIFLFFAAAVLAAGTVSAQEQDINQVTETFNNGVMELNMGNKEAALGYFQSALTMAEALGEEGAEIAEDCKTNIPMLMLSIAKDCIKAENFDEAIVQLNKVKETGVQFGNEVVIADAETLIGQVKMQKAGNLFNAKDFAGAAAAYNEIVAADTTNGMAALRLGMALNGAGQVAEAENAFLLAARHGQDKTAYKQLSNIYVKTAAAELKAKNYDNAIKSALKSNEYLENATAMKVAGTAAVSLKKNAEAIEYLEKYLELSPNAGDANQFKYTIAATAQQMGNKEKAKTYYNMILGDPKFGPTAKQQLEALK